MTMTKSQGIKLAQVVMEIRPDWDFHGIMAALIKAREASFADTAVALITAAASDGETPAAIVNSVYWPDWSVRSNDERRLDQNLRTEQIKQRRWRMELEQATAKAATPEQIAAIRAASPWPRKDPA